MKTKRGNEHKEQENEEEEKEEEEKGKQETSEGERKKEERETEKKRSRTQDKRNTGAPLFSIDSLFLFSSRGEFSVGVIKMIEVIHGDRMSCWRGIDGIQAHAG